ncbi:hypothetical protein CCP3SC15_1390008 [Gammaproteobacteria bacterium]
MGVEVEVEAVVKALGEAVGDGAHAQAGDVDAGAEGVAARTGDGEAGDGRTAVGGEAGGVWAAAFPAGAVGGEGRRRGRRRSRCEPGASVRVPGRGEGQEGQEGFHVSGRDSQQLAEDAGQGTAPQGGAAAQDPQVQEDAAPAMLGQNEGGHEVNSQ